MMYAPDRYYTLSSAMRMPVNYNAALTPRVGVLHIRLIKAGEFGVEEKNISLRGCRIAESSR